MSSPSVQQPSKPSMRRLVNFYDPTTKGPAARGRTLDEILAWNDNQLEGLHNYIQTVFPLPEESGFGHDAPVLDEETMLIFSQSPELKSNLLRALKRMLAFYGFDADDKEVSDSSNSPVSQLTITPMKNCERGFSHWVKRIDHNHFRITRIIRSLRILGLPGAAKDFFDALIKVYEARGIIGPTSVDFWTRAMKQPLQYAPDGTVVAWLEKY
ncbi:hypothetical protein HD806DRAFT_510338 [Xylariaceae sp. AK1471]|nr:hypothetical protein HD806DRAFT_510338 [Xylariaceae sp. AK1471]